MKKEYIFILLLFFLITSLFFYPLFKGWIPFPGDLLVSKAPYNTNAYFGYAPGGVPNKAQGADIIKEAFPWKSFVVDSLKKGQLPFWNPYNFSGNSELANFQSAVFYPLNVIFLSLPFSLAWSIFIFVAPFLAGFFTYLLLREFRLSTLSSLFGGMIFAFSSYMVVWMEYGNITHTFLWLPLALLLVEKLLQKQTKKYFLALVGTLFVSFLAGYIQGYFYLNIMVVLYFLVRFKQTNIQQKKIFLTFFLALIFPVLLSLFQMLPTLKLFDYSSRGNYSLEQIQYLLNPWWYSVTVLIPDFFGNPATRNYWFAGTYIERVSYFGFIPFIFAIVALFSFNKRKETRIFGIVFLVTFLLSLDLLVTKYFFRIPIPTLSTAVPTRILGLFQFCGSILAAFGFEYLLQKEERKKFINIITLFFVILILLWGLVLFTAKIFPQLSWTTNFTITKRNLILPTVFFFSFFMLVLIRFYENKIKSIKSLGKIISIIIFCLVFIDLFYFFQKITPFSPKEFIYPKTDVISYLQNNAGLYRFWGYGSGYIESNFQTYDKTFSPEGDDPLHFKTYTEFLTTSKDGTLPNSLPRPDANIAPGYGASDLNTNVYRQKVLNIDGIKYVLNEGDASAFHSEKYKLVWQKFPWQIYENLNVAPRAFLTTDYCVIQDKNAVMKTFFNKNFDEKKKLILNDDPHIARVSLKQSLVKILDYQPNRVTIQTNSNADALLFLSDNYFFSWKARVDNSVTKIYVADYTFRAVLVPKGHHIVTFYFDSNVFKTGLILSVFSAAILLVLLRMLSFKN